MQNYIAMLLDIADLEKEEARNRDIAEGLVDMKDCLRGINSIIREFEQNVRIIT